MRKYIWTAPEVADSKTECSEDKEMTFHYDSDFSGNIVIVNSAGESFVITGEALLEFVAYCYVRRTKINALEDMGWQQLLKE